MLGPDKHTWIAENLVLKGQTDPPRKKNIHPLVYNVEKKKTRLALCIMGAWGVFFPPYNVARLTGVTRSAGYETAAFDFNGELYKYLKTQDMDKVWEATYYWWWMNHDYYEKLHPQLEPILSTYVDRVLATDPDIVGFSLYETNMQQSLWMMAQLKERRPGITIIAGGPSCHSPDFQKPDLVDHWAAGEGEQLILDFLHNFENQIENPVKMGSTYSDNRLDLDSLPMPDYSDYDLSIYKMNGISTELSRGCVAQCSFCRETWFWKFRDRRSQTLLDEVEFQVKQYGVETVWFVDSLVNGNLKELKEFALGVSERDLTIRWMGYARCDGRMDAEYFQILKQSGCEHLSFGVESGSQKVLDLMNKKVQVDEINNNLRDCRQANVMAIVNWIVGYPNEDAQAAAHSINLIWNNRRNIQVISPGMTFGDDTLSDFGFNRHKYDVSPPDDRFMGWWWKLDWTSTKVNRLLRLKLMNIWLTICKKHGDDYMINSHHRPSLENKYTVTYDDPDFVVDEMPYEDFNHNIINTELGVFADSVVNELWHFLRMLWRVKGGYEFRIESDQQYDLDEFGVILACGDQSYNCYFKIDYDGNWTADFTHKLVAEQEIWMKGTKSFNFSWQASGKWSADSTETIVHQHTQDGWADTCVETISAETRAKNEAELAKRSKAKKTIAIQVGK